MAVSKPIVTIAHAVRHVPLRVELDDIEGIAQNASEMLMNVRESMLAPLRVSVRRCSRHRNSLHSAGLIGKRLTLIWEKADLGLPQGTILPRTRNLRSQRLENGLARSVPFQNALPA